MIAAIRRANVCIIARTERTGFRVISTTYCEGAENAGDGVEQVHTSAITCEGCKAAVLRIFGKPFDA